MKILDAQRICLERGIPFYAYRLPGDGRMHMGVQVEGRVEKFDGMTQVAGKRGFVLVPFREGQELEGVCGRVDDGVWGKKGGGEYGEGGEREGVKALFVRGDVVFGDEGIELGVLSGEIGMECGMWGGAGRVPLPGATWEEYGRQVREMIGTLQAGGVRKAVLARGVVVQGEGWRNAPEWFGKLVLRYPEAFVFLVSVPGEAVWMGATPEVFLNCREEGTGECGNPNDPDGKERGAWVETMALAGSRPAGCREEWGAKEVEEQAIVTEYIERILQGAGNWRRRGPFTKQAGTVEHLCTLFASDRALTREEVERLRRALHPTPAVGGFPLREALELIQRVEGAHRRYYAGYLGPVEADGTFHWFVNLRSMELFWDSVRLYVGGGITAASDPGKEWEETVLKAETMMEVIKSQRVGS